MREFTVANNNQTVGAITLVFVNPAAAPNVNLEFLRAWCSQSASATSAQQRVQLETQVTAFPTLTATTPRNLKRTEGVSIITGGTAGAAGTAGTQATAEGAGGKTVLWEDAFNVLNGYLWIPTPRETVVMPASSTSGLGLFLPAAPTSTTGWSYGMNFGEI